MASTDDPPCRDAALALLHQFTARILPSTVRRIAAWKRIPRSELADLTAELRQELALDCLQHGAAIVQLPADRRHARWMRHAERWVYRYRLSPVGRAVGHEPDGLPAPPVHDAEVPSAAAAAVVSLRNGRCNLTASAARCGATPRALRRELEGMARHLGHDAEYLAFWRRRLAEALAGLGADLLRDRGHVSLLPRRRTRPDPRGRLRRIRRIAARFLVRHATITERRVLAKWLRRPRLDDDAPRSLLEQAATLCPQLPAVWLWLFEARFAAGDLGAAAAAVHACRTQGRADRSGVTLARARLLEARGRWAAALHLLVRARRRWPHEARLRLALATVTAAG